MTTKNAILLHKHCKASSRMKSRGMIVSRAMQTGSVALTIVFVLLAGCAMMTPKPQPPSGVGTFTVKVLSTNETPQSGATRLDVTFQSSDGSTISAYCTGNLFSGLLLPSGWVCRRLEPGASYRAWWRNGSQLYVQGKGSDGEDVASLFDVTGRSH
jgi:hypothetical protein